MRHTFCLLLISLFFCTSPKAQQVVDFSTIPNNLLSSGSDTLKINTFPGYRIEIVRDEKCRARSLRIYEENGVEVTVTLGRKIALLTQTPGGQWQLDNHDHYPEIFRKSGGPFLHFDKKGHLFVLGDTYQNERMKFKVVYDRKGIVRKISFYEENHEKMIYYAQHKPNEYLIWYEYMDRYGWQLEKQEIHEGRFMP